MSPSLAARLHVLRMQGLLTAAETIRDWPAGEERIEFARRHIREAMLLGTIGRISQAEESRIFTLLTFAMPQADDSIDAPQQ